MTTKPAERFRLRIFLKSGNSFIVEAGEFSFKISGDATCIGYELKNMPEDASVVMIDPREIEAVIKEPVT